MRRKFLRPETGKYKRLKRKKKQKWRRPKGHDNKIRLNRKGKMKKVRIGFRTNKKLRGKVEGKIYVLIKNLKDTNKVEKGDIIIIRKVGKKKRQEIEKRIKERGAKILNLKKEK